MINNNFDNIEIPKNIDSAIEVGAKKASLIKKQKKNKKYTTIAASMAAIIALGFISQPAIASNIPIIGDIYESVGFGAKYLSSTKHVGKSVEANGIKITVDKLAVTDHIIKLAVKLEAENEIFENPADLVHITGEVNGVSLGATGAAYNLDKKTQVRVIEINSMDVLPGKGTINLSIYSEKHNLNETLELNVDFTGVAKNNLKKNVTMETEDAKVNVLELEATGLGTLLKVNGLNSDHNDSLLLKIDDKIYRSNSSFGDDSNNTYLMYEEILIDDIKNANSISIIESIGSEENEGTTIMLDNITEEENKEQYAKLEEENRVYEIYEKEYNEAKAKLPITIKDNMEYINELTSPEGNKVYVTNVDRKDGEIKVDIAGDNRNDLISVAFSMYLFYEDDSLYNGTRLIRETSSGFSIEFSNDIEGKVKVDIANILMGEPNFKYGEEIKLILE